MEENRARETLGTLIRVNRLHRNAVEKRFKELNIHRSQHMMLSFLASCETMPSQKQIAAHFNVTPAAIAMSLKKMEKNGLIERTSALFDNRVNIIKVSKKGREVLEKSCEMFESIDNATLDGISDEEIENLRSTMRKMSDNLIRIGAEDEIPVARFSGSGSGKKQSMKEKKG